jgi:integrase
VTTTPNKINFTTTRVENFTVLPGQTQSLQWDAATPGLGQLVSKTSSAYVFMFRFDGKSARVTIGKTASWRLQEARDEARRLRVMVDSGQDPRRVKADALAATKAADTAQQLAVARDGLTLATAWAVYLAEHKAKWSAGHYANHTALASAGGVKKVRGKGETVKGPLHALMSLPLPSLTPERIQSWLATETATRATSAAIAFRLLRAFGSWAADMPEYSGLIAANAFTSRKVRAAVPGNAVKGNDSLQREQLAPWFAAVRAIDNATLSAYLQGLLITGARRNELATLRWEDVDTTWGKMKIRDKVEGDRTIPLTPYLSSLLAMLPRLNGYVFASPKAESGHVEAPTKTHQKALKAAGLPHVSIHGLRRSFGTLAEWVEVPAGIAAQIMGHKPSAVAEKHYIQRPIDMLRKWHDKIEAFMLTEAKIIFPPAQ